MKVLTKTRDQIETFESTILAPVVQIIRTHQQEYCAILASTIGLIDNVTIIPPHKTLDPGAVSRDGLYNERDFAKYCLIPHLQRYAGQSHSQLEKPKLNPNQSYVGTGRGWEPPAIRPQVQIDEVKV